VRRSPLIAPPKFEAVYSTRPLVELMSQAMALRSGVGSAPSDVWKSHSVGFSTASGTGVWPLKTLLLFPRDGFG
jgi:hypothetical protein